MTTSPNNIYFYKNNLSTDILATKSRGLTTIWKYRKPIKPYQADYIFIEFGQIVK